MAVAFGKKITGISTHLGYWFTYLKQFQLELFPFDENVSEKVYVN